jgi:hypothetical protein
MTSRVRVHELAKELGVTSKEILVRLAELGVPAKSASSMLAAADAHRLRTSYGMKYPTVAELAAEIGVTDTVLREYIRRHMGFKARTPDIAFTPAVAAKVRKRSQAMRQFAVAHASDEAHALGSRNGVAAVAHPPYSYARAKNSSILHHCDYLNDHNGQALCGEDDVEPTPVGEVPQSEEVCQACRMRLPEYHATWWHDQFRAADSALAELRIKYSKLAERCRNQQEQLSRLQKMREGKERRQPKPKHPQPIKKRRKKPLASSKTTLKSGIPIGRRNAPNEPGSRVVDPKAVRKRVREMLAPQPPKTLSERMSDEAARETMRSHKPSTWRLGRPPSSYR